MVLEYLFLLKTDWRMVFDNFCCFGGLQLDLIVLGNLDAKCFKSDWFEVWQC